MSDSVTKEPVGVVGDSSVERLRLLVWFRHMCYLFNLKLFEEL
jgi:hypothetical protein